LGQACLAFIVTFAGVDAKHNGVILPPIERSGRIAKQGAAVLPRPERKAEFDC
jgi:hypothetical protein